uniref:CSON013075 protein n=1 Tax=Culicoides sonorensis TaxID=179676 RepID=A0A336KLB6_CULSO
MSKVVPKDWIGCPKKSYLIGRKFVAFKTPLDETFTKLKKTEIFTPNDVFDWLTKSKIKIGLWIDLTKTTRYYNSKEIINRGCRYEKIWCEGHGSVPDWKQIKTFTDIVDNFISECPDEIIGVHCTHGYNRTGYLIVSYLVNKMNFRVDDALKAFSDNRPPGIYREQYVIDLVHRYHGDINKHIIMKPFWTKPHQDDARHPNPKNDEIKILRNPSIRPEYHNHSNKRNDDPYHRREQNYHQFRYTEQPRNHIRFSESSNSHNHPVRIDSRNGHTSAIPHCRTEILHGDKVHKRKEADKRRFKEFIKKRRERRKLDRANDERGPYKTDHEQNYYSSHYRNHNSHNKYHRS